MSTAAEFESVDYIKSNCNFSESMSDSLCGEAFDAKNENFANFEKMNKEHGIQNHSELQRHSSEINFMTKNEMNDNIGCLLRTNSLSSNMQCSATDLYLKDSSSSSSQCNAIDHVKDDEDLELGRVCADLRDEIDLSSRAFFKASLEGSVCPPKSYRCSETSQEDGSHLETCSSKDFGQGDYAGGDDDWDSDGHPRGERWPPLGAPNDDEDNQSLYSYSEFSWNRTSNGRSCEDERLQQLEEEQEQLNTSLMSLTSHFAQVQFRLKQIVDASPEEKEQLLQELEEFANRGIPDLRQAVANKQQVEGEQELGEDSACMARQKELIEKLKQQLEDLENYAYQTGEGGPPQSKVMEKQRVVIEQLKGKLNLNVDELEKLTVDDLKTQVDQAIRELVNPLKMKEQLVAQLQTQIIDLERFIKYLQVGESEETELSSLKAKCACKEPPKRHPGDGRSQETDRRRGKPGAVPSKSTKSPSEKEQLRKETENIMKRATVLMNMLSFGCGPTHNRFQKNTLKKTPQGNHYGDLRAALEIAVNSIIEILGPETPADSDYTSDSEETPIMAYHEELVIAIRKKLAPALRDLIQHGLMPVGQSQSLVPFLSCFPQRSQRSTKLLHAWDLILKYYQLKKGDQYNRTPARRLSQSFNLEITGGSALTNKQALLSVIGSIIASHTPLKRSYDSHFKAFVCASLNQKKLITWLRLIFRTQILTENYYQSWSYVSKTGFEDAFRSMERMNKYNFELPVDLAVRPFQNIKDAF